MNKENIKSRIDDLVSETRRPKESIGTNYVMLGG